jgi:hypothetical protein
MKVILSDHRSDKLTAYRCDIHHYIAKSQSVCGNRATSRKSHSVETVLNLGDSDMSFKMASQWSADISCRFNAGILSLR